MSHEHRESGVEADATDHTDLTESGERDAESPANGDESADPEQGMIDAADLFVSRDPETDEKETLEVTVAGYGDAEIRQVTYGEGEQYFGDAGQIANVGADTVAEILREHVVEPDLERYVRENYGDKIRENARGSTAGPPPYLTGDVIREEMKPFVPMVFLRSILTESGMPTTNVRMNDDGSATVQFDEGAGGNR